MNKLSDKPQISQLITDPTDTRDTLMDQYDMILKYLFDKLPSMKMKNFVQPDTVKKLELHKHVYQQTRN